MNEIVESKSFKEKMQDRIKDSIGELMTDEELSKIIEKAVNQIFFEPTHNGYNQKDTPPFLHSLIKALLEEQVRIIVNKYIKNHTEEVKKVIDETISKGIGNAMIGAISDRFQNDLLNFKCSIANNL